MVFSYGVDVGAVPARTLGAITVGASRATTPGNGHKPVMEARGVVASLPRGDGLSWGAALRVSRRWVSVRGAI